MIDDNALEILVTAHKQASRAPACLVHKGTAIIHSRLMVLELPAAEIKLQKLTWPARPWVTAPLWRTQLPADVPFLIASVSRETDAAGSEYVQLTALTSDMFCYMQGALYDLLREQFDSPSFRVMDGVDDEKRPLGTGIFVDGSLVGVVSHHLPKGV